MHGCSGGVVGGNGCRLHMSATTRGVDCDNQEAKAAVQCTEDNTAGLGKHLDFDGGMPPPSGAQSDTAEIEGSGRGQRRGEGTEAGQGANNLRAETDPAHCRDERNSSELTLEASGCYAMYSRMVSRGIGFWVIGRFSLQLHFVGKYQV